MHSVKTTKFSLWIIPKICPTNPKWQTAAIFKKMDKLLYFSNGSTYLKKFCMLTHIGPSNPKKCSKNLFKNPWWWTDAILKNVNCDIFAAVRPILMKFGTMIHLRPLNQTGNQNFKNFKIQDGGWHLSWKLKNRISQKLFGRFRQNFAWWHTLIIQSLPAVQKIKHLKIQDGG